WRLDAARDLAQEVEDRAGNAARVAAGGGVVGNEVHGKDSWKRRGAILQELSPADMKIASNRQPATAVHAQDLAGDERRIQPQPQHRASDVLRRALAFQCGTFEQPVADFRSDG